MQKIKDRLSVRGVEELTSLELLTIMLDDVVDSESVAKELLAQFDDDINRLSLSDISQLRMIEGLGMRRAPRLVAAFELGRRAAESTLDRSIINNSADVVKMFRPLIGTLPHEECWVLHLNCASRLIDTQRVSSGGVSSTIVDVRMIIKRAVELLATDLILVHNHPSGSVAPSEHDIELTKRLNSAAELFDIKLLDHMIISADSEYSFTSAGLL